MLRNAYEPPHSEDFNSKSLALVTHRESQSASSHCHGWKCEYYKFYHYKTLLEPASCSMQRPLPHPTLQTDRPLLCV